MGFAHIGVLKAFEEHGILPYHVSGASIGALIGVMYAEGYPSQKIAEIVEEHKLYNITSIISLPESKLKAGLSGHRRVGKLLRKYVTHDSFEGLARRFSLSVVDIRRAECRIVSSGGGLIDYLLASMSLPLAFDPKPIGDGLFIDGGMMNNLPVEPLVSARCNSIIAVDVQAAYPFKGAVSGTNILALSYRLMQKQMNADRIRECDFYISFPELEQFGVGDFKHYKKISDIGYKGTKAFIEANPKILKSKRMRTWL